MIRVAYCVLLIVLLSIVEAEHKDADYWINRFNLNPALDGGYYKLVYESSEINSEIPERYGEEAERTFGSHMYSVLKAGDVKLFHRLKSDELLHHYKGATVTVYIIDQFTGKLRKVHLGPTVGQFVVLINHGDWIGAKLRNNKEGNYCLVGVTIIPGFTYADSESGDREKLLQLYPQHEDIIMKLTTRE